MTPTLCNSSPLVFVFGFGSGPCGTPPGWPPSISMRSGRSESNREPAVDFRWLGMGVGGGGSRPGVLLAVLLRTVQVKETARDLRPGCTGMVLLPAASRLIFFVLVFGVAIVGPGRRGAAASPRLSASFGRGWRSADVLAAYPCSRLRRFLVTPIIPYFTFGENFKMAKGPELRTLFMLFSTIFRRHGREAYPSAKKSRGRTAVTLMRQTGLFAGANSCSASFLASYWLRGMMIYILSLAFYGTMMYAPNGTAIRSRCRRAPEAIAGYFSAEDR